MEVAALLNSSANHKLSNSMHSTPRAPEQNLQSSRASSQENAYGSLDSHKLEMLQGSNEMLEKQAGHYAGALHSQPFYECGLPRLSGQAQGRVCQWAVVCPLCQLYIQLLWALDAAPTPKRHCPDSTDVASSA